ncbi:type 4b pilus protein PilO2 [Billgrantia desiderata]|uniref:type 4b pilus protein PilO2 n=1 Tax=Billgrantia desiderata TaxID=52021 RepID=UPI001F4287F3|nr:type 4b pilus protein PilO2 [Halomonas desiderata]MCE8013932.1 type 4b pilus protein PilO2 [Halomonas desiderata]
MGDGRSSVTILTINGHQFVVGLLWKTLARVTAYEREAKEFGKSEGMDIVVLRRTEETAYAGFVQAGLGAQKGQLSLAMALHGELGNDWFGAFETEPGSGEYFISGVSKHTVLPKGDHIVGADAARQFIGDLLSRFNKAVNEGRYRVFAPPGLGIPIKVEYQSLTEILDRKRFPREYRLRPLTWGMTRREWSYLGLCSAIVIAGMSWYSKHQRDVAEAERQAELRRQQLLAELEEETGRNAAIEALEYPWVHQPDPQVMYHRCIEHLLAAPMELGGWQLTRGACSRDAGETVLTYQRAEWATARDFLSAAEAGSFDFYEIDDSGELALTGFELQWSRYGDEPLLEQLDAVSALHSHYQRRGREMRILGWSSSGYDAELIAAGAMDWRAFQFEVRGELIEFVELGNFYQAGLRLEELLIDLPNGGLGEANWILTGEQYVR